MTTETEPRPATMIRDFHLFRSPFAPDRAHVLVVPTSALFDVDAAVVPALEELRTRCGRPSDENGGGHAVAADERAEWVKTLHDVGILGPAEVDDVGLVADGALVATPPPVATVVVLLTGGCNLTCGYCFADQGSYRGTGEDMTEEVGRQTIDFAIEQAAGLRGLSVQFLGGEPLVKAALLRRLILYGETRAAARDLDIRFGFTTNGTLLTPELITFLLAHHVQVSISIDGPRDVHDATRHNRAGGGSYDRIIERVGPLLRRRSTRARVTLTRRCLDAPSIVDHLLATGFAEVGVTPVSSRDPEFALTSADRDTLLRGFDVLVRRTIEHARRGKRYGFTNLIELVRQIHEGRSQAHPCGAGIGYMAATADGSLHPCHRFPDVPETKLGSVTDGVDPAARSTWLEATHVHARSDCARCWARYICSGGCYHLSIVEYGDVTRTFTEICDHLRAWYELGLGAYAELSSIDGAIPRLLVPAARSGGTGRAGEETR